MAFLVAVLLVRAVNIRNLRLFRLVHAVIRPSELYRRDEAGWLVLDALLVIHGLRRFRPGQAPAQ